MKDSKAIVPPVGIDGIPMKDSKIIVPPVGIEPTTSGL
jgi:hypothetical protein